MLDIFFLIVNPIRMYNKFKDAGFTGAAKYNCGMIFSIVGGWVLSGIFIFFGASADRYDETFTIIIICLTLVSIIAGYVASGLFFSAGRKKVDAMIQEAWQSGKYGYPAQGYAPYPGVQAPAYSYGQPPAPPYGAYPQAPAGQPYNAYPQTAASQPGAYPQQTPPAGFAPPQPVADTAQQPTAVPVASAQPFPSPGGEEQSGR